MTKKLITKTLATTGTTHQPGNIYELNSSRKHPLWQNDFRQSVKTRIRYRYHAYIWLNRTKGIICRLGTSRGNGVKNSRLPYVGQPNNAALKSHVDILLK
jgi:hypothetical protein